MAKTIVFTKSPSKTHENTSHTDKLEVEADELLRCKSQNIQTRRVQTVKLIGFDKQKNELKTEFVQGDSLFNYLWNGTSLYHRIFKTNELPEDIISICREIGEWLRKYHDSSSDNQSIEFSLETLKQSFGEKIEANRKYRLLDEDLLDQVDSFCSIEFEKMRDKEYIQKQGIKICMIHADFACVNMMCNSLHQVYIHDFAEARIGTNFEDIGRFYEFLYGIAKTSTYRNKVIGRAMDAFVSGYGFDDGLEENTFFMAIRAYNCVLNSCAAYSQRPYLSFSSNLAAKRMTAASIRWLESKLAAI